MSTNYVTVTAAFSDAGEGNYLFAASGELMSTTDIAIVVPVIDGSLDVDGNLSVSLMASDNFDAGQLKWNCFVRIQGLPLIHEVGFVVNFDDGASQNLFTILEANGWTLPATS